MPVTGENPKFIQNPHGRIDRNELQVPDDAAKPILLTDTGAGKLAVQDAERAELWLESKQWALQWRETDILYQSPRTLATFENSGTTRANNSRFTVAKAVNSIVPEMKSGIFYTDPPFVIRPGANMKQDTARAKTILYSALLRGMAFEAKAEQSMECQALNGTTIAKYGMVRTRTIKPRYIRKKQPAVLQMPFGKPLTVHTEESDEFEIEDIEITKTRPFFEVKELGQVMAAPGWRESNCISKARYVIEKSFPTLEDLDELREQDGYVIPSREYLLQFFLPDTVTPPVPNSIEQKQQADHQVHHAEGRNVKDSADPTQQPMGMIERTDKHKVIVVLVWNGKHLLIKNEKNVLRKIPYLSANWWNIQGAGHGMGIGRLIGSDQRLEQGSLNAACDILAFSTNPQYARDEAANVPTQQIRTRLGGIITVKVPAGKGLKDAFGIVEQPKVPAEVFEVIAAAKQSADDTAGSDESFTRGMVTSKQGAARTATGAAQIGGASAKKIEGPVGRWVGSGGEDDEMYGVMIPFLYALDEMVREFMPMVEIRQILNEETESNFELDMGDFLNGTLRFEALAGAHLAAKKAMAQSLPLMITILENPHLIEQLNQTGYVVDVREFYEMMMEVSEWRNQKDLIRRMTPKEAKLMMMMRQAAPMLQAQSKLITENQKHHNKGEEIDQQANAKLAHDLLMSAPERAAATLERSDFTSLSRGGSAVGIGGGQ